MWQPAINRGKGGGGERERDGVAGENHPLLPLVQVQYSIRS